MIECFDVNDLLPILPQAPFPQDVDTTTTSIKGDRSTTTTIDVRAPIDTTATTGPTGSNP